MSWINAAIGIGSAIYQGYQANQQTKNAKKAGKDPLARDRRGYADDLQKLQDNPSSFFDNPMYQAAFDQGQQGVARQFAAGGYLGSGNMATGLQKYGQSFGWDMYMNYSKYLAEIAGFAHFTDPAGGLNAENAGYNRMDDAFGQIGGVLGRFGNNSGSMPMPSSINTPYNPSFPTPTYSGPAPSIDVVGPR